MTNKLLSVCLITYNHEKFIRNAIEGILMQKVDFEWELIIADDCSTDGTQAILNEYKNKYPDFIKLILQKKNVGPAKNHIELITTPKSKYIALCDGDDYWTDPLKLQKQVDFLETNKDYVLCFHEVKILKPDGSVVNDFITKVPENYETIETLARLGNYIHTPTVVYRNILSKFPFEFEVSPIGDYFMYMMLAEHGKLKFIDEKMAIYRHNVGILSGNDEVLKLKKWIECLILILSNCKNEEIKRILYERCQTCLQQMFKLALKVDNKSNFSIKGIVKSLKNRM